MRSGIRAGRAPWSLARASVAVIVAAWNNAPVSGSSKRPGRPRTRKGPRGKLGKLLRAARAARGVTQAEAAEDLGIDRATLAEYETGSSRPVGLALRYLMEVWIPRSYERDDDGPGREGKL